jgi:choline dehydrogenase-like flavoprotein
MLYVRGNKKDYDIWESLGNPGWGSEEAMYYFKKSEDNRNPYLARTPYHSTGGYLTVQEAPWHTPLAAAFVQAGVEMGYVHFTIFIFYTAPNKGPQSRCFATGCEDLRDSELAKR